MADRPINLKPFEVRAVLDGRKRQTRQPAKVSLIGDATAVETPYRPGDRLWVKERVIWSDFGWAYEADGEAVSWPARRELSGRANDLVLAQHMRKPLSRLTLIVEEVRVQRLQDISEPDVWAEGLSINPGPPGYAQEEFAELWNSLHGPEAWAANPFVAALTFRVERANIDTL